VIVFGVEFCASMKPWTKYHSECVICKTLFPGGQPSRKIVLTYLGGF
jgi:hypothetical protein